MRAPRGVTIAWGIAALVFVITTAAILYAPKAWLAKARVEISPLDVAPTGMAGFVRVDFAYGNRMLPQEMVARMTSSGTLRRALKNLQWPDDEAELEKVTDAVIAHLVPGSTVIEVMARSTKRQDALMLVEAVIAVQDDIRREERGNLARQLLSVLETAAAELGRERRDIAGKLSKMDVHVPVDYSTLALQMERTLAEITSQRMKLAESLRHLEDLETGGASAVSANSDPTSKRRAEEDFFTSNAGFAALRARLAAREGDLAKITTTQGTNNAAFRQAASEIQSLEAGLRQYLAGASAQLRSQMEALDQSTVEIEKRMKSREEALTAVRSTLLSPEYESLMLRSEMIREQLKQIEMRRAEVQTYQQLFQPPLRVVMPPEVGEAPEDRFRAARVVFAAFGALLAGLSLSAILRHRAAPLPETAFA